MTRTDLASLYAAAVDALCAKYPRQSRAHYLAWLEGAKLGRTTKRIRTKGGFTDIAKGSLVLFAADPYAAEEGRAGGLEVWAPRADGMPNHTLVGAKAVKPVCELCGGSGQVKHKTGFVTFACPEC